MKKILSLTLILFFVSVNIASASTRLDLSCTAFTIYVTTMDGLTEPLSTDLYTNNSTVLAHALPGYTFTYRAFLEFDLSAWYALGLPVSDITDMEFSIDCSSHSSYVPDGVPINIYAMTTLEDGIAANASISILDHFNCGVDFMAQVPMNEYYPSLSLALTGANLSKFTDDIATSQLWTGIEMRSTWENVSNVSLQGGTFVSSSATLGIIYTPSIPEPSVIVLFLFGLGFFMKKRHSQ